jgi:hypothetical protein
MAERRNTDLFQILIGKSVKSVKSPAMHGLRFSNEVDGD